MLSLAWNLWIVLVWITSLKSFQLSTHLERELFFLISFLSLLPSPPVFMYSTQTKSSWFTLYISFIIFHLAIKFPLSLFSFKNISSNLSSYVRSLRFNTIIVGVLCVLSTSFIFFFLCVGTTLVVYSSLGHVIATSSFFIMSLFMLYNATLMFVNSLWVFSTLIYMFFGRQIDLVYDP